MTDNHDRGNKRREPNRGGENHEEKQNKAHRPPKGKTWKKKKDKDATRAERDKKLVDESKLHEEEKSLGVEDAKEELAAHACEVKIDSQPINLLTPADPKTIERTPLSQLLNLAAGEVLFVSEIDMSQNRIQHNHDTAFRFLNGQVWRYLATSYTLSIMVGGGQRPIIHRLEGFFPVLPANVNSLYTIGPFTIARPEGFLLEVLSPIRKVEAVNRACSAQVSLALNLKAGMNLEFLVTRVTNYLRNNDIYWSTCPLMIQSRLLSDEFAEEVNSYQQSRTRTLDVMSEARYRALLNQRGYTTSQIERFMIVWKLDNRYLVPLAAVARNTSEVVVGSSVLAALKYTLWNPETSVLSKVIKSSCLVAGYFVASAVTTWFFASPTIEEKDAHVSYANVLFNSACAKKRRSLILHPGVAIKKSDKFEEKCPKYRQYDSYGLTFVNCPFVIPSTCEHNFYEALCLRMCREVPVQFSRPYAYECIEKFKQYAKTLPQPPWPNRFRLEWLLRLAPRRRKAMENAPPLDVQVKKHFKVKGFNKVEPYIGKLPVEEEIEEDMWLKPRMIACRSDEYQNHVGEYFYNLNIWLKQLFNKTTNYIYDSGLTATQLGDIAVKMNGLGSLFCMDMSSFDGSVESVWYSLEHWVIEELCPVICPDWHLIKCEWNKIDGGAYGLKYTMKHGRRSGDMWTSCFNTLINLTIMYSLFGDSALCFAKGDDSCVGTSMIISNKDIIEHYAKLGFRVKVSTPTLNTMDYCSGYFWILGDGRRKWGLNPLRILPKLGLNLNGHPKSLGPRLLTGTLISLLPIGLHVPLVSELISGLLVGGADRPIEPPYLEHKISDMTTDQLCYQSYCQLAEIAQVSVDSLLICSWRLSKIEMRDLPCVVDCPNFQVAFRNLYKTPPYEHFAAVNMATVVEKSFKPLILPLSMLIVTTLLEEALCKKIPLLRVGVMWQERRSEGNLVLHLSCHVAPWQVSLPLHLIYNLLVFRSNMDS